jgi:alcohol dehydrogenase
LGGLAIENSMLGAAHAAANPLTAHFNIVHGQAVGIMLPSVVRFNAQDATALRLYESLDLDAGSWGQWPLENKVRRLATTLEGLLRLAAMPRCLSECGVTRSAIPLLAAEAAKQWTAGFNPRPVTESDFIRLYEESFE